MARRSFSEGGKPRPATNRSSSGINPVTRAADWLYVDPFVRSSEDSERRLSLPPTRAAMGVKDGSPKDGTAALGLSIDGALLASNWSP